MLSAPFLILLLAGAAPPPPLLPRTLLLGAPERSTPQLSPDGLKLAWLQPDSARVMQVWVRGAGAPAPAVRRDPSQGIRRFAWARDSQGLLFLQGAAAHLFHLDLASGVQRELTPWPGVAVGLLATDLERPNEVLVTANRRDARRAEVWRVDLRDGSSKLDTPNPGDVVGFVVDSKLQVRGAIARLADGATELRVRDTPKSPWRALVTAGVEERVTLVGFTLDGKGAFVLTTIAGDAQRLIEKNLATGSERTLASLPGRDVARLLFEENRHLPRAVAFAVKGRLQWTVLESALKGELEVLGKVAPGEPMLESSDTGDQRWLVSFTRDDAPTAWWLYDRRAKVAEPLFSSRPGLEGLPLARSAPVEFQARDGLPLEGYLTLPAGALPAPLVLLVHGGPWARDDWGFDGRVQLYANRGYAVLQVNFRGSTGLGKRHLNLGNKQWGLAMQDDLLDAVAWAVGQRVADPARVAIVGEGYGGYAALAGLAFSPETFACGVALAGPSNLLTYLAAPAPPGEPPEGALARRVGDLRDPADRERLTRASPFFAAARMRAPLLIGQGGSDPRLPAAQSEQLMAALKQPGLPVTAALYPDEGQGFLRSENREDFYARAEQLLGRCLGGRVEPLPPGGKVPGASVVLSP